MFCGKCGAENTEKAMYCAKCGAKIGTEQEISGKIPDFYNQPDISNKNRKVGMIAVAVAAVFIIILLGGAFGGRSYKSTVNQFFNAMYNADAEKIINLLPDGLIDYVKKTGIYSEDDLEMLGGELTSLWGNVGSTFGNDWEVSHRIISAEELSKSGLANIQDAYELVGVKVKDAKTVKVEVTAEGGGKEYSDFMEISVIKVGRSWYIDMFSMSGFSGF